MFETFDFSKYIISLAKFLLVVLVLVWDGAAAERAPGRVISTKSATIKLLSPVFEFKILKKLTQGNLYNFSKS